MTRKEFLERTALASASYLLSSVNSLAADQVKLKVGVIGCGSVSTQYLPHLSQSPFVTLVSACDVILDRAKIRAKEYNIPNVYSSIDKMIAGAPFDLLVNLTDMQEHERLNRQALQAGKHVWSEKPMANTYAAGKELYDFAKNNNLRIWGAPAVVNSPQFSFMSEAIQAGKLGKVSAAHAHYGHLGPTWSAFFYESGGGSLPDLGVYNIATLTGLLGPAKSVVAMTSIVTKERTVDNKGKIEVKAEDNAMLILNHGSGVLSHIQCGFNYFDPYGHEGKGQEKHTINIWGTHGNMGLVGYDWAPFGVDMATHEHAQTKRYAIDTKQFVWQEGASVVAESIVQKIEPRIATEHALHVLEIIEGARLSGQEGKRVDLRSKFQWPMFRM